jgi:hypothetical protein
VFPTGDYQLQLPDGTFSLTVSQSSFTTTQTETLVLGTVTVNGGNVTANFTVPASSTLSGTVHTADGSPIPANSFVLAVDAQAPGGTGCAAPGVASGLATVSAPSGSYSVTLPRDRTYRLITVIPVQAGEPPQDAASLLFQDPATIDLPTDTMRDVNIPMIPGTVQVTGTITDPGGLGVASTRVNAVTDMVSGAPNVIYSRSTTTDANGVYRLVVLQGSNYRLDFVPSPPAP